MRKTNYSFIWIVGTLMVSMSISGVLQTGYSQINQTQQEQIAPSNMSDNQPSSFSSSSSNMSDNQSSNMSSSKSDKSSDMTGELALMALDLDEIEDNVGDVQEAIAKADTLNALDSISKIENSMATLEKQPKILQDIKNIKDSLSNNDFQKATEDIVKIQSQISQVKTQNPEIANDNDNNDDSDDDDN